MSPGHRAGARPPLATSVFSSAASSTVAATVSAGLSSSSIPSQPPTSKILQYQYALLLLHTMVCARALICLPS